MDFDRATPVADHRLEGGGDPMSRRICQMRRLEFRIPCWRGSERPSRCLLNSKRKFIYSLFASCDEIFRVTRLQRQMLLSDATCTVPWWRHQILTRYKHDLNRNKRPCLVYIPSKLHADTHTDTQPPSRWGRRPLCIPQWGNRITSAKKLKTIQCRKIKNYFKIFKKK